MLRRVLLISLLALLAPVPAHAATARFRAYGQENDSLTPTETLRSARGALLKGTGVRGGSEVTPLLKQLALKLPSLAGPDRRRALRLLARPTPGQGSSNEVEYQTAEHRPELCSEHFCIHWVDSTADAPPKADANGNGIPDYVETMDSVFENVYRAENVDLGWRPPKSDGTRGCLPGAPANCPNKVDVYIKEVGSQGIYGYSAPDPNQRSTSQAAYLVMDNDYKASQFPRYAGDPLKPMQVTAAHEYSHVLQFGYDTAQDTWMFESTATWMEDRVYTDVNDYLQYLTPWSQMPFVPLTYFSSDGNDALNVKVYGDSVWSRWIDARYGPDTIRDAWARSRTTSPKSFAPGAYDAALRAKGTSFYEAFANFAADTAEWRASNTPFSEGASFPDMERTADDATNRPITLVPDRGGASGTLSHTAFILLDVRPQPGMPQVRLAVDTPRGTRMVIALVGRTGDELNGTSRKFVKLLPHGGPGIVTVDDPSQYSRLTAVIVNADASAGRYSQTLQDWAWRKDSQAVSARVSTDFAAPSVRRRSPRPGAHGISTRSRVKVSFSDAMYRLTRRTVRLTGPGRRTVKARLKLTRGGRRMAAATGIDTVVLTPVRRLRRGTRYTIRLGRDLRDPGGNALPASALRWSFVTKR